MVDTLEIAKKLEGAGFDRSQAEALASVVSTGAGARNEQLDDLRDRLKGVEDRLSKVESGLEALGHKLEAQVAKAQFQVIVWTVGALGVLAAIIRLTQ